MSFNRNVSFTYLFYVNALRFETDVVLNILPCAKPISLAWRDPRCRPRSVTRISFKYKLLGFRRNVFKNDFSVHYFVFVHS